MIKCWGLWPLPPVLHRRIQSWASGRHLSVDDPVLGAAAPTACSALDDPVRGGLSRATDDAVVLFWPLLLVLPRMIQSGALHGVVTASLHQHGLLVFAAALLLFGLVFLAAAPLHHGLVLLSGSLHHQDRVLIITSLYLFGLGLVTACLHDHCLVLLVESLHHRGLFALDHFFASPRRRPYQCCTASCRRHPLHCTTASPWLCPLRCIRCYIGTFCTQVEQFPKGLEVNAVEGGDQSCTRGSFSIFNQPIVCLTDLCEVWNEPKDRDSHWG